MDEVDAGYEFSASQERVLRRLYLAMSVIGAGFLVMGLGIWGLVGEFARRFSFRTFLFVPLAEGLLFVVSGGWTFYSARRFRAITKTEGRDVPHLMEALTAQRKLFTLWIVVIVFHILLVVGLVTFLVRNPAVFDALLA